MNSIIGSLIAIIAAIMYLLFEVFFGGPEERSRSGGRPPDVGKTPAPIGNAVREMYTNPAKNDVARLVDWCVQTRDPPDFVTIGDLRSKLPEMIPYKSRQVPRRNLHIGQFKLFLSEVQFLTEYLPKVAGARALDAPIYVVYAGSAPGHHDGFLADMFKNITWVLIDPHEHDIFYKENQYGGPSSGAPRAFFADTLIYRGADRQELGEELVYAPVADSDEPRIVPKKRLNNVSGLLTRPEDIADRIIRSGTKYKYHIIEDLFTNDLATALARLKEKAPVLYVSDIRTNTFSMHMKDPDERIQAALRQHGEFATAEAAEHLRKQSRESRGILGANMPTDLDILWNNAQQLIWVNLLAPSACMLKFRPPWGARGDKQVVDVLSRLPMYKSTFDLAREKFGIDIVGDYGKGIYQYMKFDKINLQVFPGTTSDETRLMSSPANYSACAVYDKVLHENALYSYNICREFMFYERNRPFFSAALGLDGCADCNAALGIMRRYCELRGIPAASAGSAAVSMIARSLKMMRRTMLDEFHGAFFKRFESAEEVLVDLCYRMFSDNYFVHVARRQRRSMDD